MSGPMRPAGGGGPGLGAAGRGDGWVRAPASGQGTA